ncbi:hypothetical protein [Actinosynnema mirum]|uniref:Uncharacterized protein n=1 Tax=Actinosynnema mirum (strain ATCC 29888 / DSM 43827 / JCM 3225 / NBRC 14064 / NCIMB 13271 / NRRL B-12336 / IMRU 3971 / 101) TaxID=446462 RepID=C6WBM9_ACTMD|nr:hypothetical protein [Actinosynnema mirum]ACU35597.1 hypothetical protein Amir_1648 [Actinosynnema mirum DSM 43827]
MANQPRTPQRAVRVPDDRWEAAGEAATTLGLDRSAWINQALAWLVGEPGARRPTRPTPPVEQPEPPAAG